MRAQYIALSVIVCCFESYGQVPDICSAAFKDGLRENYEVFTVRQRFEKLRTQLLSIQADTYSSYLEKAASASAGLDIPIVDSMLGFSADASSSSKEQNFKQHLAELRNNVSFQQQVYETFKSNSSILNTALASIWNGCAEKYYDTYIKLHTANGVFLDVRPFDETAGFVARVTVRSDRVRSRKVVGITPADSGLVCTTASGRPALDASFNTGSFDLTCRKSPDRSFPFTVTTEDGSTNTVSVPSRTSKLLEMRENFDELSRTVGTLTKALNSAQERLNQLQKGLTVDADGSATFLRDVRIPGNRWEEQDCKTVTLSAAHRQGDDVNFCENGFFLVGIDMDDIAGVPTQSSPLPARAKCCRP